METKISQQQQQLILRLPEDLAAKVRIKVKEGMKIDAQNSPFIDVKPESNVL
jgi:transcriptional regulator